MSTADLQAPPVSQLDLHRLRAETPGCAHRCHLNNAGAALMPQPVLDEVRRHLDLEAQLGGYEAAALAAAEIEATYAAVGALIGAPPAQVALVENATAAFAQALSAVPFERGDVLLTTRADYVSNQVMFLSLARRLGIEVVRAPDTAAGGVDVDAVAELLRQRRPRLVSVTHMPTYSGLIQPVAAIGELCRHHDVLFLVDACQSVGQLVVDVRTLGCDFLTATGRKFLRGPRGTGFLYVSERVLAAGLEPLLPDLRGTDWLAPDRYVPQPDARRFENWEFAYALVRGLGAAARYALEVGLPQLAERTRSLADLARRRLAAVPGLQLLDRGPELGAILTLGLAGREPEELVAELRRRGINTSATHRSSALLEYAERGIDSALRVSPHYYNSEHELEALAEALTELSAAGA